MDTRPRYGVICLSLHCSSHSTRKKETLRKAIWVQIISAFCWRSRQQQALEEQRVSSPRLWTWSKRESRPSCLKFQKPRNIRRNQRSRPRHPPSTRLPPDQQLRIHCIIALFQPHHLLQHSKHTALQPSTHPPFTPD